MRKAFFTALFLAMLALFPAAFDVTANAASRGMGPALSFRRLTLAPFVKVPPPGEKDKKPGEKPSREDETIPVTPPGAGDESPGETAQKSASPEEGAITSVICGLPPAEMTEVLPGAGETRPLKIAVVPLIDRTRGWLTARAAESVTERIDRELHIPLNDTMRWAEYLPEGECESAFYDAAKESKKLEDAPRKMAEALGADLAVVVMVETFYERTFHDFRGYDIVESAASVRVLGYDAVSGRVIKERASGWDRDELGSAKRAEELLSDALDEALRKARLKDAIFPLKK